MDPGTTRARAEAPPRRTTAAFLLDRPAPIGFGLAALVGAALLLAQALQHRAPFGPDGARGFFSALVHIPIISYLPAAYLAVVRGARKRLGQIRPMLPTGEAHGTVALPPLGPIKAAWLAAASAGILLGVVGPYLTEPDKGTLFSYWNPGSWSPEVVWHRVLGLIAGAGLGLFAYAVVRASRHFSRAARDLETIDLFELTRLRPFVNQALSNGILAAALLSFVGLFALNNGITPMLILLESGSICLVAVALALPLLGLRRRIREEKKRELQRCGALIARESGRVRDAAAETAGGRLADLLAYRTLVQQVPALPLETPVVGRMVLYLLLPLGSWIASGLVQSGIERLLGR